MQRGEIVLKPGASGAPWDLRLPEEMRALAGQTITLLPTADGAYQVVTGGTGELEDLEVSADAAAELVGGESSGRGLVFNHAEGVIRR